MLQSEYRAMCSLLNVRCPGKTLFADDFFRGLGAHQLQALDASPYEGADLIYDLNLPLPKALHEKWSCVIDAGSLEHVFNFPEAIRSVMQLVEKGGHFLCISPWNNLAGHGFYQFSPELFYRIFSNENGFEVEKMLFLERGRWFSVQDPKAAGARIEMRDSKPLELHVSARRTKTGPIFLHWPQQSDYSRAWDFGRQNPKSSSSWAKKIKAFLVERSSSIECLNKQWQLFKEKRARKTLKALWAKPVLQSEGIPS